MDGGRCELKRRCEDGRAQLVRQDLSTARAIALVPFGDWNAASNMIESGTKTSPVMWSMTILPSAASCSKASLTAPGSSRVRCAHRLGSNDTIPAAVISFDVTNATNSSRPSELTASMAGSVQTDPGIFL